MAEDKDLWALWSHQRGGEEKTTDMGESVGDSDESRAALVARAQELDRTHGEVRRGDRPEGRKTADKRAAPLLTGKLAVYLKEQPQRTNISKVAFRKTSETWSTNDMDVRASAAMALVLANHLARFGGTAFSERSLEEARDSLLCTFSPDEAIEIEVEAYELIQWFAGAMNPEWREQVEKKPVEGVETQMMDVLNRAIIEKRDLVMRYYTGSRGVFSERRITPILVTAEKYLVAFCHLRQDERVFRLSRIVQLSVAEPGENDELFMYPIRTAENNIEKQRYDRIEESMGEDEIDSDHPVNAEILPINKGYRKNSNRKVDKNQKKVLDVRNGAEKINTEIQKKHRNKKGEEKETQKNKNNTLLDYMEKQDKSAKKNTTKKQKHEKDNGPMLPGL